MGVPVAGVGSRRLILLIPDPQAVLFSSVPSSSYWYWKGCHMSSAQVSHGSSCMLMTWQLSLTLWKSECQSSRHGRRAVCWNGVGARTQSSACSALTGRIRDAMESRAELLQTKTMFAQGVNDKLIQLMADHSHQ